MLNTADQSISPPCSSGCLRIMIQRMKKRSGNGIQWYAWNLLEQEGLTAGITCRQDTNGEDFNLALHVPCNINRTLENRRTLTDALRLPFESFTSGEQVHSLNSRILSETQTESLPDTDALILTRPGILGVIFTADCLPVILYDRKNRTGSVIHAGWKGTAGGIVPLTLERMIRELGSRPEDILAVSGPAIGFCCYQVDRPVYDAMVSGWPETENAFTPDEKDHWRLSLETAVKSQLIRAGVKAYKIETAGICTCCHKDFYSWRGDGPKTGRMATFLSL